MVSRVKESDGWGDVGGIILKPVVEAKLSFEKSGVAIGAPVRTAAETGGKLLIGTGEGQVVEGGEVTALDPGFHIIGDADAGSKEEDGPAGLGDVFAEPQPELKEVAVAVVGAVKFGPPENVGVEQDGLLDDTSQGLADGRFACAAGSADDK